MKKVYYCSDECKQQHKAFHQFECTPYQKLRAITTLYEQDASNSPWDVIFERKNFDDSVTGAKFAIKMLIKNYCEQHLSNEPFLKQFFCHPDSINLTMEDYWRLYSPRRKITDDERRDILIQLADLVLHVTDKQFHIPRAEIIDLMCKDACNSLGINGGGKKGSTNAYGIYPVISYFNHSCTPNCETEEVDCRYKIRTVVDVKEGEELTISYITLDTTNERRKFQLDKVFNFTCVCKEGSDPKNCNKEYLEKYLCTHCRESLLVCKTPGSEEKICLNQYCRHEQIGYNI